jgi:DNA-binding NtrC family response regulator
MGEHVDTDEGGLDRISNTDGAYRSEPDFEGESFIRANIPWRGGDRQSGIAKGATKIAPFTARRAKSGPLADEAPPMEQIIIGSSPPARILRETIYTYADNSAPVLIAGETGVGKELVANELHRRSGRRHRPFVAINTGAIPATLASSELFGHRKGAFTGAYADQIGAIAASDGGVLFLDEIGDMPLEVQAQLLRVLDDGLVTKLGARTPTPIDFRLIAATNVDLRRNVACGSFRRDLYHRLDVLVIDVPPLRDRGDDVIEIGEAILRALPEDHLRAAIITPKAGDRLRAYRFPGNVRELRNVLTRAAVRASGGKILPEHVTFSEAEAGLTAEFIGLDISKAQDLVTRFLIMKALIATDGNVTEAAKLTGRGRSTIHEVKKQINGNPIAAEFEAACAQMRALVDGC